MIGNTVHTQLRHAPYKFAGYKTNSSGQDIKYVLLAGRMQTGGAILHKPVWEQAYHEAANAFANRQFAKAYQRYKFVLDNYAEYFVFSELLICCGLAASKHGEYELALRYFEQCFKINPTQEVLDNIKITKKSLKDKRQ